MVKSQKWETKNAWNAGMSIYGIHLLSLLKGLRLVFV